MTRSPHSDDLRSAAIESPIGRIGVVLSPAGLVAAHVGDGFAERMAREHGVLARPDPGAADGLAEQVEQYFDGARRRFDVDIDWRLVTGFAREAMRAVLEIPYGETASYGEVAAMAGRPRAARAVGTACRTAPLSLFVPVHRVIRADGSLGEYGGNEPIKRFLIDIERASAQEEESR